MDSRKEIVDRAIEFRHPERVPIVFWNRDQTDGDVMLYHLSLGVPGDGTARKPVGLVDKRMGLSSGIARRRHDGASDASGLARVAGGRRDDGPAAA